MGLSLISSPKVTQAHWPRRNLSAHSKQFGVRKTIWVGLAKMI